MAFTDAEMAVLSELTYSNSSFTGNDLGNTLKTFKGKLESNLGPQYEDVINGLIKKIQGKDYKVVNTYNKSTGFGAFAVIDSSGEATVAARGTDGFHLNDKESLKDIFYGDLGLIMGNGKTSQHKDMEKFIVYLSENKKVNSFDFTGHSLGGNLAMYGAIYAAKLGKKVNKVFAINAPQFSDIFMLSHLKEINKIKGVTKQIQNQYDIVSSINEKNAFGTVEIGKSIDTNKNVFDFNDHSSGFFALKGDGFETGYQKMFFTDFSISAATSAMPGALAFAPRTVVNLLLMAFIGVALDWVGAKLHEAILKRAGGINKAKKHPYFKVDTVKLKDCASRISNCSRQAKQLGHELGGLYSAVLSSDGLINGAKNINRLSRCEDISQLANSQLDVISRYLYTIADKFEKAELNIQRGVK